MMAMVLVAQLKEVQDNNITSCINYVSIVV